MELEPFGRAIDGRFIDLAIATTVWQRFGSFWLQPLSNEVGKSSKPTIYTIIRVFDRWMRPTSP